MSEQWHRVTDVRGFLSAKGKRSVGTHSPKYMRRIPWPYCSRCGLLYLKNEPTQRALLKPCVVEE